ncbi:MAG: hypothetical protein MI673_06280 [Thiotrichales bacterium]|nr:hypothetical protein [Thiotrichales bacterium]
MFQNKEHIKFSSDIRPLLISVIDTEEEFDWLAPASRTETSVQAMGYIDRVQKIFDEYNITPCYVVDYPVVTQPVGYELLHEFFKAGRCEIGAHLHPWVTPPYTEELSSANTYPGNLTYEQEKSKLNELTLAINEIFNHQPVIYKAGRYGFGKNTGKILAELGYQVDLSVCPPVDYRDDGGPDYSDAKSDPYWFGENQKILEIPVTGCVHRLFRPLL